MLFLFADNKVFTGVERIGAVVGIVHVSPQT
jgi:hypothetical protein